MKKILISAIISTLFCTPHAAEYQGNVLSTMYSNEVNDVPAIRNLNGGTVIIPIFDETCPEVMKSAFSYACKIVEDYMPPTLPLKVKVTWRIFSGATADDVSKVNSRTKEDFAGSEYYKNATTSAIKGVLLSEVV